MSTTLNMIPVVIRDNLKEDTGEDIETRRRRGGGGISGEIQVSWQRFQARLRRIRGGWEQEDGGEKEYERGDAN